jgi:transposase
MYIATVPNRNSPPAILLREGYRENGKVKTRTLANLSSLAPQTIEGLRRLLRGETLVNPTETLTVLRSLPHGHVAAVLGTLRRCGLEKLIATQRSRSRDLVVAMICSRVIDGVSKLSTAQGLSSQTARNSLGEILRLEEVKEDELYQAMDWLLTRQDWIEAGLAKEHLSDGALVLYDVSSTYMEGHCCPLATWGHNRDGKKDKQQIVFGLLCNAGGCPVSVEVFEGNTSDSKTLLSQIQKVRTRFGIQRIILVGDRGMITEARIREDLKSEADLDWITALRAPAIKELAETRHLQPELYDDWALVEIRSPQYPGERLIVCKNPQLALDRKRTREELLAVAEKKLEKIRQATTREKRRLKGEGRIGMLVGKTMDRCKMKKHFHITINELGLQYSRDTESIEKEAALDGLYVIRTSVERKQMSAEDVVSSYKGLSVVERAFRSLKTVDLKIRPIFHWTADRVRSHVFLCMLAYYVEWHMREALKPILFDDTQVAQMRKQRITAVAPRKRSPSATQKADTKVTATGIPVQSFRSLVKDLSTLTMNKMCVAGQEEEFVLYSSPTRVQAEVFKLLGVSCMV